MDLLALMDSSDDELLGFPSPSLFGRVDAALSRPSLRRQNRRSALSLPDAADILHEIMSILTGESAEESPMDADNDDSNVTDDAGACSPSSLLELSAQVVAKHCTCSELEHHKPPLDESLLQKVAYWAFPQDVYRVRAYAYLTDRLVSWRRGVNLVKEDKIREMWQVGFMATAYLAKYGQQSEARNSSEIRVSLVFERQKIVSSTCSECKNEVWCEHVIASVLYRIKNPAQVRVHAPMTETLSTLDRNQLQKLLQYAVQDDPAGVLGKVFKHLDDIRDSTSEMSMTAGAPDPTFGSFQGDKTQWQLSLEQLEKRLGVDLDSMIRARSFFDYSEGRSQEYYPDSFDISIKMQSKFFFYITPILELARQQEYMAAAEVMKRVATIIVTKMSTVTHTECASLSRLWHDLSHVYSLLLLKTEDPVAKNLLVTTAEKLNKTRSVGSHLLPHSAWAELPSVCSLYALEVASIKEAGGEALIEPLVVKLLSPCPKELKDLLSGDVNVESCMYDEDVVAMLARLETVFYFEFEKSFQKIARLAFIVLHKLAILAQTDSVIGAHSASSSPASVGSSPSLSASSQSSPSSAGTPRVVVGKGRSARVSSKGKQPARNATDSVNEAASTSALPSPGAASLPFSLDPAAPVDLSLGRRKSTARMSTGGGAWSRQPPAKRFKKSPASELITNSKLSKGQVAHAMLYTLRLLIATQKASNMDSDGRKMLTGFCLQALEISRHRTMASSDMISHLEQDWLLKLETCVCDYLQTMSATDASDAVILYLNAITSVGTKFYAGAYPLVLLEMLCHLCVKDDALKAAKSRELVHICSDILLNMTSCLEKVTLPMMKSVDFFWEVFMDGGSMSNQRKHREFALRKFHVITETFLSLVGTETRQDVDLLVTILKHFENIRTSSSTTMFPLLKMISKDLRLHVWRFKEEHRVIEAMLRFSIHAYQESQHSVFIAAPSSESGGSRHPESVEREFIFSLARNIGSPSLAIFSECWERIFSCRDLQELILMMEPKDGDKQKPPTAAVTKIIMEFYDAKRYHDEDACTLMTHFFNVGDENYNMAAGKIVENADNYHATALFQLAFLQQENERRKDVMTINVFEIVTKAFGKITTPSFKILEHVDWIFRTCTSSSRRDLTKSVFYTKMINLVCTTCTSHPEILLRILQKMELHTSLMQHSSAARLGSALVSAYREHFLSRFRECGHAAYATVISEMQRARLECKHYVKNGDTLFDCEVIEIVRRSHSTKKKLIKLLGVDFPEPPKPSPLHT